MSAAKYPQRLTQAAEALQILSLYPAGMSVPELSGVLGTTEYDLRGTLASYHRGREVQDEVAGSPLVFYDRPPPATFAEVSREDWEWDHATDADRAVWVRREPRDPHDPFHVMLTVDQVVDLLTCAATLQDQEPDNETLRSAIAALRVQWFPQTTLTDEVESSWGDVPLLRQAVVQRRKVRFVYCREWRPGVEPKVVEPYVLRRTHLGFELDAGPVRANGRIRTYLVRNLTDVELLDESFERPRDVDRLIAANRDTLDVSVVVPNQATRDYESLVQDLHVIAQDPTAAGDTQLSIRLQQPFDDRLAMVLLRAGPRSFVIQPAEYADVAERKAQALLAHHGLT